METFAEDYLRCDVVLTLAPASASTAYPAQEVAAAIGRLRGVRGASRRPDTAADSRAAWDARRWRWLEDSRQISIGFSVRPAATPDSAAIWDESPLEARCDYADVARLTLALWRRLPALRLRLPDQRMYTASAFIDEVARARLAPALASDAPALRELALAADAIYAELLASAPPSVDAAAAFAVAPFTIVYEDKALLAVNKPAGVVTHPTYKHPDGTLTDAVFAREESLGLPRPWLLHRLDKETSGVTLFARTDQARRALVSQFEQRAAHKRYLALAVWPPQDGDSTEGEVDAPLARDPLDRRRVVVSPDGQPSRTRFRRLGRASGYALLLAEPVTGRTHQIRAHLAAIGAPLVGDAVYLDNARLRRDVAPRVMLHAWRLDVRAPGTGEPLSVCAPPPQDFLDAASALGLGSPLRDALAEGAEVAGGA